MNFKLVSKLIVLSVVLSLTYACDSDPDEECLEFPACEVSANNCITDEDGNGYFTYNGEKYPYTLDNVADVQKDLLTKMCPVSSQAYIESLNSELSVQTLQFINEARTAALCD